MVRKYTHRTERPQPLRAPTEHALGNARSHSDMFMHMRTDAHQRRPRAPRRSIRVRVLDSQHLRAAIRARARRTRRARPPLASRPLRARRPRSGGGGGGRRHELGRIVRTLVRVHGCQLLLDGVYNADPHPGNVLVLPDGRLGLIDYGMVGRLSAAERAAVARVVRGLHARDAAAVVREYSDAGYRACWHSGEPHGAEVIYRLATFHLDRIDLSPVAVSGARGGRLPVLRLLQSTIELAVPDWIEQARRLGGLLIGVGSQTGRPLSLAAEWASIAEEVLEGHTAEGVALPRRLRTHLTGIR